MPQYSSPGKLLSFGYGLKFFKMYFKNYLLWHTTKHPWKRIISIICWFYWFALNVSIPDTSRIDVEIISSSRNPKFSVLTKCVYSSKDDTFCLYRGTFGLKILI